MAVTNGRVTLVLLGHKLDTLISQVSDHMHEDSRMFKDIRESLDGCDEYPGVRGRLDRLEQSKKSRDKHFWAIYGLLISAALTLALRWLN